MALPPFTTPMRAQKKPCFEGEAGPKNQSTDRPADFFGFGQDPQNPSPEGTPQRRRKTAGRVGDKRSIQGFERPVRRPSAARVSRKSAAHCVFRNRPFARSPVAPKFTTAPLWAKSGAFRQNRTAPVHFIACTQMRFVFYFPSPQVVCKGVLLEQLYFATTLRPKRPCRPLRTPFGIGDSFGR